MAGRDRTGVDARGTIGDVELIGKPKEGKHERLAGAHRSVGILPRKAVGVGLLVILAGLVVWVWPSFNLYVLSYLKILDAGPRIVGWVIFIIASAVVVKILLLPILDMISR
jgi:hypothetical protein